MRLQLLILRHALPPVRIVHTTGTGPASHTRSPDSTIADLLNDVNDLVPLESADGEWGLEDYVVEVPGPDPTLTYECLHYQTCEDVLREFDEVTIRALSSEDLRVRRLGGRHQISGDGKHLIDGVGFGKQWLKKTSRPGILIPPRKKRKLLLDESNVEDETDVRQISGAEEDDYTGALVPFFGDDEDDDDEEDDEDFVDELEAVEQPLQITLRGDFDDADAESEDDSDPNDEIVQTQDDDLPSEVKDLLEDAAAIEDARNEIIARHVLEKRLKRKRDVEDDGEDTRDTIFEGFSSPIKSTDNVLGVDESDSDYDDATDSLLDEITVRQAEKVLMNIIREGEDDDEDKEEGPSGSDTTSDSDSSSSESDSERRIQDLAMQQAKERVLNLIRHSEGSSSGEYDSESEEDTSSDSGTSEDDAGDDAEDYESDATSSSGSDSESEDDSESESAISSAPESQRKQKQGEKSTGPLRSTLNSSSTANLSNTAQEDQARKPIGLPFEGTNRTRSNNNRVKRKRKLNLLKQQGLLPENADFKAMELYEEEQNRLMTNPEAEPRLDRQQYSESDEMLLQEDGPVHEANNGDVEMKADDPSVPAEDPIETTSTKDLDLPAESQPDSEPVVDSAPKRARLDLASSRRMLFASLGLRNPKTPEAEAALREKLSKSVRPPKLRSSSNIETAVDSTHSEAAGLDDDAWKSKLVVTAVECQRPGVVLPPPPFPFQQGWAKSSLSHPNKRQSRDQAQYDQEDADADFPSLDYGDAESSTGKLPTLQDKVGDIPIPGNLDSLPDLNHTDVRSGAVIAYKELHVDASTNYQPEISSYRVGRVSQMDADGTVHLQLTQSSPKKNFDDQTGERVYGKFELHDEDGGQDEADDGTREILLSNMISGRLVRASSVEVPESSHVNGLRGGDAPSFSNDDQFDVVPESAEEKIDSHGPTKPEISMEEIATPRKQEISDIIKEAGFDSALDEQLLQPIAGLPELEGHSQSPELYPHRFRPRSSRSEQLLSDEKRASEVEDDLDFGDEANGVEFSQDSAVPESPSVIHMQESVEYPHISQMEIKSSEPLRTANSSSHQDAQKISPAPAVDLSFATSEPDNFANEETGQFDEVDEEDASQPASAPKSDMHPSSAGEASVPSRNTDVEQEDSPQMNSFLGGLGYDGHASSHEDQNGSDHDSDHLPSLDEIITSSQKNGRQTRSASNKVSPPPTRKSLRTTNKKRASTSLSSPDLPPSSQPAIKMSQSQREPRLSQIPVGSQVVDLTFSSDTGSPRKDELDLKYGKKKTGSQLNGSRRTGSNAANQDLGIGTRRLLTSKKPSDGYY